MAAKKKPSRATALDKPRRARLVLSPAFRARQAALEVLEEKRELSLFVLRTLIGCDHPHPVETAWEMADTFLAEEARRHPDAAKTKSAPPPRRGTPTPDPMAVN
jgi:hypothetical protein